MSTPIDTDTLAIATSSSRGQEVLHPSSDNYRDTVLACMAAGYTMCADLTAVDYLGRDGRSVAEGVEPKRFELVVNLLDMVGRRRLRLRIQLDDGQPIPSIVDLHPAAEAMEREAFDMFGITFDGHPDHTRILLPETWVGHPLRKDFSMGRIPVQFKDAPQGG